MEIDTKQRILGLDTGTNSLGWAVVDRLPEGYKLVDKGVHIFQEGVTIENGNQEKSRAAERTKQRSLRKQYWRRKVRKIFLLQELSNAGLCPPLSLEELHRWRVEGIERWFQMYQGSNRCASPGERTIQVLLADEH